MIYKRGKLWWMDNVINGVRYRESLVTTNQKDAKNREKERVNEILQGRVRCSPKFGQVAKV